MKTRQKHKGFTLVELMVVIAIIGILAGVVLVSVSSMGERAKTTAALEVAKSTMPLALECVTKGFSLNNPGYLSIGGSRICSGGANDSWPPMNTRSSAGWYWGGASGSGTDALYYAYNPTTEAYILCPVTSIAWRDRWGIIEGYPGTCEFGDPEIIFHPPR